MGIFDYFRRDAAAQPPPLPPKRVHGYRRDGWLNIATNLGSPSQDKTMRAHFDCIQVVEDNELSAMFHYDPTSRKICRKPGDEALREGINLMIDEGDHDALETASQVMDEVKRLEGVQRLADTKGLEEAFGGAALWLGTDDSAGLDMPPGEYSRVHFLKPIDRRYLEPEDYDEDPRSPGFMKPLTYRLSTQAGRRHEVIIIHRERLIIFEGRQVTEDERERRRSWGLSILQIVYESIQRHAQSWQAAGYAFIDRGYGTLKIANLYDLLEREGGREAVEKRAAAVEAVRSVARAVVIGEDEEWSMGDLAYGGMPEMLREFMHDLSSAVDIPVTVLFGRSPAGMNATGESDLALWYDHVREIQTHSVKPKVEQLLLAIMKGTDSPTKGQEPDKWSVSFPPLKQLNPLERADQRLKISQADKCDIEAGVLFPEEVARNRYRPEGYSVETTIDLEARDQILDEMLKQAIEEAKMTPEEKAQRQADMVAMTQPGDPTGGQQPPQGGAEE